MAEIDQTELEREAKHAKMAARQTAKALLQDVERIADPRQWTKAHPWTAIGAALIGGFVAGTAVTKSRHKDAEPTESQPQAPSPAPRRESVESQPIPLRHPWLDVFVKELISLLVSALGGRLFYKASESQNGQSEDKKDEKPR
ncbi:MAG: hypothetical protein ABSG31_14445 [Tepidisphaeraceae bacterium]|jgi:hypothetical protein